MNNKKCFKCNTIKPLSEFYKHKAMGDGYLGKCKDCTKRDTKERTNILLNDNDWVLKEKKRAREKYHRLYSPVKEKKLDSEMNVVWMTNEQRLISEKNNRKNWKLNNPDKEKLRNSNYRKKYPEKYKAVTLSNRLPCEKGNHLHHWSYNIEDAKDCIELNLKDHALIHRFLKYDQCTFKYKTLKGDLLNTKEKHLDYINSVLKLN